MGISRYPRPGHRIAPVTLTDVLDVPIPRRLKMGGLARDIKLYNLDETIWKRFDLEACQQLSEAIVEQVRLVLPTLADKLKTRHLPLPSGQIELKFLELEVRTYNCLVSAAFGENPHYFNEYTIGKLIKLRGFGARSLVDLLTSLESMNPLAEQSGFVTGEAHEINLEVTPETLQTLVTRRANGIKPIPQRFYEQSIPKLPEGIKLNDLELRIRTYNCLRKAGYSNKLQSLTGKPICELLKIRGFGSDCLIDLLTALHPFLTYTKQTSQTRSANKSNFKGKRSQGRLFLAQQELDFVTAQKVSNEDVIREAKRLRRMSDTKRIRRDDLRLGQLLRAIDITAKNALEVADKLITGANVPANSATAVHLLQGLRKSIRALSKMTLEDEIKGLLVGVGSQRNQSIIAQRFGWDGSEGATLQEVGDSLNLTRERVRQVCNRLSKHLEGKTVFSPTLDHALNFVSCHIPDVADEIELKLIAEGIANGHFRLEGIINAAELLGRGVPFSITKVGGKRLVLAPNMENATNVIAQTARRAIEHWGVTTILDIAAQVAERTDLSIDAELVRNVLSEKEDFQWLDEADGWFWLSSVPRNRLLNQIEKILSVAESIDVSELRAGISRHHRMKGVAPTKRVLLELCRQTSWCRVEDRTVIADPPLNWEETLSDIEQFMVLVLKEHGPVMGRSKFEELCINLGINRVTFYAYLKYSPAITKYAISVYGLRGVPVPPGVIESLKPDFSRRRGRVLMDYGWTPQGKVWIGYKVSEAMLKSGVIVVPGPMKRFIAGEFTLKTEDGLPVGRLVVKESSAWSLGSFFRRRGGEAEDYLVLLLDLADREATIYIGDEDLLDDFQTNEESIDTSQIGELVT
jgi:hypothetical protein